MGLCILRKTDQAVRVTGPATIRIYEIKNKHVRLRIEAPESTKIIRVELEPKP